MTDGEIVGIVLFAPVTAPSETYPETLFGVASSKVNVPALIVSHQRDVCRATPPDGAPRVREALSVAPRTDVFLVTGGSNTSPPKESPTRGSRSR